LADCDSHSLAPGPILVWIPKNIFDLIFTNAVTIDVRVSGIWIDVKAELHPSSL